MEFLVDRTDTSMNQLPTVGPVVEFVDSTVESTVAPNLETLGYFPLPAGAVQCRMDYPFAKNREDTFIVEECCKCQSQTKCQTASGANHFNIAGAKAMMQPDEVVDRSEFSHLISKSYRYDYSGSNSAGIIF